MLPVEGEVFRLRKLLPASGDYDFNVHVMDFHPGERVERARGNPLAGSICLECGHQARWRCTPRRHAEAPSMHPDSPPLLPTRCRPRQAST